MAPKKASNTANKNSDKTPVARAPTPVTPPRRLFTQKIMSATIKRVQAVDPRYSQQVDVYSTLVSNLKIIIATKPKDGSPEASYTNPMVKMLLGGLTGAEYSEKWNILSVMGRRGVGNDIYRRSPMGSKWVWKCFVALAKEGDTSESIGRAIARAFTAFTRKSELSKMDKPESYVFRAAFDENPKPLSHFLADVDCVALLRSLYAEYEKSELMEDEYLMLSFFGDSARGRAYLENMNNDEWDDLNQDGDN